MISSKKGPDGPKASGYKSGPPTHLQGSSKGSARAPGRQPRAKPGVGAEPAACQVIRGGRLWHSLLEPSCPSPFQAPWPCQAKLGALGTALHGELEEGQAAPSWRI